MDTVLTQIHNVFVMVQIIVKSDASLEILCIGFDIPQKEGGPGVCKNSKVLSWVQLFLL